MAKTRSPWLATNHWPLATGFVGLEFISFEFVGFEQANDFQLIAGRIAVTCVEISPVGREAQSLDLRIERTLRLRLAGAGIPEANGSVVASAPTVASPSAPVTETSKLVFI